MLKLKIIWNPPKNSILQFFQSFKLTFLNVSRTHRVLPKPRISTGCWVNDTNIINNRCIFIGNECQSHWHSSSFSNSHWFVTISPNSHMKKISMSDISVPSIDSANTIGFIVGFDLKKCWAKKFLLKTVLGNLHVWLLN